MQTTPLKIGRPSEDGMVAFAYPNIWSVEATTGPERIVIAPERDQVAMLHDLTQVLPEPFGILYVLVVSHQGHDLGRYQSPYPLSRDAMDRFLATFRVFFESDARHHVWVSSPTIGAHLVFDNHDVIYAYGLLEQYKAVLRRRGLNEGIVRFPVPHAHFYNAEFDNDEARVMGYWPWTRHQLAETDNQ